MKLDEKYRPRRIQDFTGLDYEKKVIAGYLEEDDFPHFIFHGPPGCGKTAMWKAIVEEYYGEDASSYHKPWIEINASDDRGIDTIRDLKTVARYKIPGGKKRIIVLEEADGLTSAAQFALKAMMQLPFFERSVRFIFTLNDLPALIEPIRSRCKAFYFPPLPDGELFKLARRICDGEGIEISDESLEAVIRYVRGDARKLITNYLEDFRVMKKVTPADVKRLVSEPEIARAVCDVIRRQLPSKEAAFEAACKVYSEVRRQKAINVGAFIEALVDIAGKAIIPAAAEVDFRLHVGCNEPIQMAYLFTEVVKCLAM